MKFGAEAAIMRLQAELRAATLRGCGRIPPAGKPVPTACLQAQLQAASRLETRLGREHKQRLADARSSGDATALEDARAQSKVEHVWLEKELKRLEKAHKKALHRDVEKLVGSHKKVRPPIQGIYRLKEWKGR